MKNFLNLVLVLEGNHFFSGREVTPGTRDAAGNEHLASAGLTPGLTYSDLLVG